MVGRTDGPLTYARVDRQSADRPAMTPAWSRARLVVVRLARHAARVFRWSFRCCVLVGFLAWGGVLAWTMVYDPPDFIAGMAAPTPRSAGEVRGDVGAAVSSCPAVCSHQGRLDGGSSDARSLFRRLTSLGEAGVRCHDVDVTLLGDGETLVVGHPKSVYESAGQRWASELKSVKEARAAGVSKDEFPTLQELVRHFGSIKENRANENAWISFELKEDALSTTTLSLLDKLARQSGLQLFAFTHNDFTNADWITNLEAAKLDPSKPGGIKLGWAARDVESFARDARHVDAGVLRRFKAERVFPSIKMSDEWYSKAQLTANEGIAFVPWVVDSGEELEKAMRYGARGVISNFPMKMKEMVHRRCRALD